MVDGERERSVAGPRTPPPQRTLGLDVDTDGTEVQQERLNVEPYAVEKERGERVVVVMRTEGVEAARVSSSPFPRC